MEEYPRNVMELEKQFSTEEACLDDLFRLRWPNGFICPRCQASQLLDFHHVRDDLRHVWERLLDDLRSDRLNFLAGRETFFRHHLNSV